MSDMLAIGASGVMAYQAALTTTSENISNASTPGYSRRTVSTENLVATTSATSTSAASTGSGVRLLGVTRLADDQKAAEVRSSGADLAKTESSNTWMTQIDGALTGSNLSSQLTTFFTSATTLASDPSSSAARSAMLQSATSAANAFSSTGSALDQVASDIDDTADQAVTQLTTLGKSLAQINTSLGRAAAGTDAAANLQDQRDQILEKMSAISDVSVTLDTAGRATVQIGSGGPTLVSGSDAGTLTYARNDDGTASFALHRDGEVSVATPSGGTLAGVVDGAQRVASARQQLNAVATSFTSGVNAVQAQGQDLNGNTGTAMFATGTTPTDITLSLTDPSGIAAATAGGGKYDNGNLANLASMRTSSGVESNVTAIVSDNAAALASGKTVASAQTTINTNAVAARDAVSGVNLDDEAVDLMKYQQAYSAAGRVIQMARDTFQTILNIQ